VIDFRYEAPRDVDEAVRLLVEANGGARLLAGGTDLIVQMREFRREASLVVDVKYIPELMQIQLSGRGLKLGAGVPCWRIHENSDLAAAYPALVDAVRIIGGWQIQSRATVGGNLCNASPAADSIPPLIVLGAVADIAGPGGRRERPVATFCTAPGRTVLEAGELLVSLTLPAATPKSGSAYERFIPRNEMDIAVVGVASWVQLDNAGERIVEARVALAAAAPTPLLADEASRFLAGREATEDVFSEAAEHARRATSPISDMRGPADYRQHLAGVLTRRTLATAVARARG